MPRETTRANHNGGGPAGGQWTENNAIPHTTAPDPPPAGDSPVGADGIDWDALLDGITGDGTGFGGGSIDTGGTWGAPGQDQSFQDMINQLMLQPSIGSMQSGLEGSFDQMLQQLLNPQLASGIGGQGTNDIASLLASGGGRTDYMDVFNPAAENMRAQGQRTAADALESLGSMGSGVGTGASRAVADIGRETTGDINQLLGQLDYNSQEGQRGRQMAGNQALMSMLGNQMGLQSGNSGLLAQLLQGLEGQEGQLINSNLQQFQNQLYGSQENAADRMSQLIPLLMGQQNTQFNQNAQMGTIFQQLEQMGLDAEQQEWLRQQLGSRPEILQLLGVGGPTPPGVSAEATDNGWGDIATIATTAFGGGGES